MDKRKVVELFLKEGVLLSPEEMEKINEENYLQMLREKKNEDGVECEVKKPRWGKVTTEEYVKMYNENFEFLKNLLLKKTRAVSIDKGRKIFSEVTIIGRVKEIKGSGFVLEDVTGETEVSCDNRDVNVGDVIGLKGRFRENVFFPEQVIWPDIPLGNEPKLTGRRVVLTPSPKGSEGEIVISPIAKEGVIGGFGKRGEIIIKNKEGEMRILAYSPPEKLGEDEAVKLLKKRRLPDEKNPDNAIRKIPHIFWLFNNSANWSRNYKGVTIISTNKGSFAEYENGRVRFGKL